MVKKKNKKNIWKIIVIIVLLLSISLFIIKESKQKRDYNDCVVEKELCMYTLNESLKGWYQCIYNFGTLYFNLTDEEIQEKLDSGNDFYNLNNQEVKK